MGNLSTFFPAASSSNVLEKLAFQCTGDSMTNSFGNTITSENVTSLQSGQTTTFTKINGSQIAYTPPAEATRVIYEFRVQIAWHTGTLLVGSGLGFGDQMQFHLDVAAVENNHSSFCRSQVEQSCSHAHNTATGTVPVFLSAPRFTKQLQVR